MLGLTLQWANFRSRLRGKNQYPSSLALQQPKHCNSLMSHKEPNEPQGSKTGRATRQVDTYHCLKGVESTCTMQFFTRVLVLTNSLLLALYTTSMTRVFRVTPDSDKIRLVH